MSEPGTPTGNDMRKRPLSPSEAIRLVNEKYNLQHNSSETLRALLFLEKFSEMLDGLEGRKILDVGCGNTSRIDSSSAYSQKNDRNYEPWFCRALQMAGGHAIGIDIGNLDTEEFEHYQDNFLNPHIYDRFDDSSFDGVLSSSLFGETRSSGFTSPALRRASSDSNFNAARNNFFMQDKRVLKEGGVLIVFASAKKLLTFRKVGGELVQEK